ncbi:MAG: hypothetical protein KVP17_001790 [Porospora cf. gigantea B]|uniref:uncharacterized protein n=1 Tax=Porospora cf. gigantea B TaxID=2853592 RepID=UPI003571CAE8|nr:MAG: hypothetical protein KVP17_001790 [Porospora cf. gigantea B]
MFYDQNDAVTRPDILRLDGSHLLTVYKHQVGGHADSMKKARGSSLLLKPFHATEAFFYRFASAPSSLPVLPESWYSGPVRPQEAQVLAELQEFLPRYHGSASVESENGGVKTYVQLEDIIHEFRRPCVLDIKMGRRQRKLNPTPEKTLRQIEKSFSTTSHALGFRLCGCQVFDETRDVWTYRDKYACRRLPRSDIEASLMEWLWNGTRHHVEVIPELVKRLRGLRNIVKDLQGYRLWSSSLLLVYDSISPKESLDVRVIDFVNCHRFGSEVGHDEEYIYGLNNLEAAFIRGARDLAPPLCVSPLVSGALQRRHSV